MLPTIPTTPSSPLTSCSFLGYCFALGSYRFRCFAFKGLFFLFTFTTGAAVAAVPAFTAVAACIAWRIAIAGSGISVISVIFFRAEAKQHGDAEAGGGKQSCHG